MEMIIELLQDNIIEILATIITAVASYIGIQVKNVYTKYVDTKTKKEVVNATVKYVEQICNSLEVKPKAEEKFIKAKEKATEWLNSKGITIGDTEIEILIESAVKGLKGE